MATRLDPPNAIVRSNIFTIFLQIDPREGNRCNAEQSQEDRKKAGFEASFHRRSRLAGQTNWWSNSHEPLTIEQLGCHHFSDRHAGKSRSLSGFQNYRCVFVQEIQFLEGRS